MERLMTERTFSILQEAQQGAEEKVRSMGAESGSGDARAGVHDDASFEHEKNRIGAEISRAGNLSEAVIIKPRKETHDVGIGNKIFARFVEDQEDEVIYLLGPDDVIRRTDLEGTIVSVLSPLGKAIFGKKKGDDVEVKIGDESKIHVNILDIKPGDF